MRKAVHRYCLDLFLSDRYVHSSILVNNYKEKANRIFLLVKALVANFTAMSVFSSLSKENSPVGKTKRWLHLVQYYGTSLNPTTSRTGSASEYNR
jgi:hypothetical protein